jgi:hypothetical protein
MENPHLALRFSSPELRRVTLPVSGLLFAAGIAAVLLV